MTRFLIVVAALLLAAGANGAEVGRDPCRKGPSYWCSSVQLAVKCQAFTHCLQTVWEPQLIDVQQTEACLDSQDKVETARHARTVDGKIYGPLVTSLCNSAEDEETKGKCHITVTEFLPEVLRLLESKMESPALSALLGLCRLYDEEAEIYEEDSDVSGASYRCQDCHNFLREARHQLSRPKAEKKVIRVLEKYVCSKFSDLEIWCKAVVDVGVPKLLKFIEENDEAETLCGFMSVCTESEDRKLKTHYLNDIMDNILAHIEVDTDADVVCHDCDKVLTALLAFAKDSPIRTSFEQAIAHLCSYTSLNTETCRLLSEGFSVIPEHLHSASQDVDVSNVCRSLVGCVGDEYESEQSHPEELPAPEEQRKPVFSPVALNENLTPDSPHCMQCVNVLDGVRRALMTERSVVQATYQAKQTLCQQMDSLADQCNTIVDVFAPVLVEWLFDSDGSRFVCSQLKVCPKPADMKSLDFVKTFSSIWHPDRLSEVASVECEVCNALMEEIVAADRNPDVQNAIVDFFNGLCDKLGQEAGQCKALVDQYAPQLFELLASELDPTMVCELLMSCTKPGLQTAQEEEADPEILPQSVAVEEEIQEQSHMIEKQTVGSMECSVCRLAMEAIDKTVAANSTEEKLNQMLGKVCSLLPSQDVEACEQLVDTWAPAIVSLLLQQLEPRMICDELGLCKNGSRLEMQMGQQRQPAPPPPQPAAVDEEEPKEEDFVEEKEEMARETIQCELCQLVVGRLDQVLAENKTEAAVEKALDEVCEVIPDNYQQQCLSLVDQYSGVLLQLLLQELQPQQVCIFITLCPQAAVANAETKVVKIALPEIQETPAPVIQDDANSSRNKLHQRTQVTPGEVCLMCQTLTNYLQEALSEQATQDELEKLLEDVCTLLPNSAATCDMVVKQFTPLILELLKEKTNPLEICQHLKLCSSGDGEGRMRISSAAREEDDEGKEEVVEDEEVQMVGTDSCTYGPGFWCASMDNARKCGMVRECVEKYGMKP